MKALVIGSGAREHALVWKFSKSKRISGLYSLPGNAGTGELGENIPGIGLDDFGAITEVCRERKINLVFIGPEAPLAEGLADHIAGSGIQVVNPLKEAAKLESSKLYSKQFMLKHSLPTAGSTEFTALPEFEAHIIGGSGMRVVKKNGLAAGKGVLESSDNGELLEFGRKILKSDSLLVEEYLTGYEISIFTLFDGKHYVIFPPCADYKKARENDEGNNTGGMGAICPVPGIHRELAAEIEETIIAPTFAGIKADSLPYRGFLYFGLMITDQGPKILEYNVRLGDPEAQVLLPLIDSDFGDLMDAVVEQTLDQFPLRIADSSAVGVVVAAGGYPGKYKKGTPVTSLPEVQHRSKHLFHASTEQTSGGKVLTGGGRCFTAVGCDKDFIKAQQSAYEIAGNIAFKDSWYRRDIGKKFLY